MKKKIRITTTQLKAILRVEPPKFPMTIIMKGISKAEIKEIVELIKSKKKD